MTKGIKIDWDEISERGEKECSKCGEIKPLTKFVKRSRQKGWNSKCNDCYNRERKLKKENGGCHNCSNKAVEGKKQCENCLERQKERKKIRKENSECVLCGAPLDRNGAKCQRCYEKDVEFRKNRLLKNKCVGCGQELDTSINLCNACRDRKNETMRKLTKENKLRALEIMGNKCEHCGLETSYISVYDFHHIAEDKENDLGNLFRGRAWDLIEAELKKTILLCSNCHRILHEQERIKNGVRD